MRHYTPDSIYVEASVEDSPITKQVLDSLPFVPVQKIDSSIGLLEKAKQQNLSTSRAKKSLLIAEQKGEFFKSCPGQQSKGNSRNVCCNYYVLNFATNCHMECSYCYLQAYLNFPYMVVYANLDKLQTELDRSIADNPQQYFRVGTGELADSLALDAITAYSKPLVEYFAERANAVLELKTKTDCIENLLDLRHKGRTVIAWSLNPPFIQETEEHKTASIDRRIRAAQLCVEAGYPVAFHFDPIIHYPGWKVGYQDLIRSTLSKISSSSIAWISLGALRMPDKLKEEVRERFPSSVLPLGELVPGGDGKLRYFKPIRIEIYDHMRRWIERWGSGIPVYACMERPEVWSKSFGTRHPSDQDLGDSLVKTLL
jgi:spore photoproduct lyase